MSGSQLMWEIYYRSNKSLRNYLITHDRIYFDKLLELPENESALESIDVYEKYYPEITPYIHHCQCGQVTHKSNTRVAYINNVRTKICVGCSSNYYYWSSTGCFYDIPDPNIVRDRYHGTPRHIFMKGVDFSNPGLIGLEIETLVNENNFTQTIKNVKKCGPILAEEDGSLDYEFGVEFVFAPTTLDKIVEGEWIHKAISILKHNAIGWGAGKGYGMHISINASVMSKLHVARFCHFINSHKSLCTKIAGRKGDSWAPYEPARYLKDYDGRSRCAAYRDKNRIEVRIFRSSLNWKRIRRNCEFVDSVREFTKITGVRNCTPKKYLKFLEGKGEYGLIREFVEPLVLERTAV